MTQRRKIKNALISVFHKDGLSPIIKKLGFERLILKNGTMRLHFTTKTDSTYFESEIFGKILEYLKLNFRTCKMTEKKSKLYLVIKNIKSASKAIDICKDILR